MRLYALAPALLLAVLPARAGVDAASVEDAASPLVRPADPAGLRPEVLDLALEAFRRVAQEGRADKRVLTVIDYSLPSTQKRLWVFDLEEGRLLFHGLVAHGRRSGELYATRFSNASGSHMSSLGVFVTAGTYQGKHGLSLVLLGLEPGVNDKARERAIVLHAADYATEAFARRQGRLGRSWGCPALAPDLAPEVIRAIQGGSVLFAYAPDEAWLSRSRYLGAGARGERSSGRHPRRNGGEAAPPRGLTPGRRRPRAGARAPGRATS